MANALPLKAQGLILEGISNIQTFVLLEEALPSWAETLAVTINKCCYISETQMELQDIW